NGAPNENSARSRSLAQQHPVGEKTSPLSGTTSRAPAGSAATPSVPEASTLDAVSPSQPLAATAAPAINGGGVNRRMTRAEDDKKVIEWRDKQLPARSETAEAKQGPEAPLGYAVRLDSWAL